MWMDPRTAVLSDISQTDTKDHILSDSTYVKCSEQANL